MGNENELWDDSALINAFDNSIQNYKKIHGKATLDNSKAGEQEANGIGEDLSGLVDANDDTKRQAAEDANKDAASHSKADVQETSNGLPSEINHEEPNKNSSYVKEGQKAQQGYSNTQGAKDYNQLLNQYNKVEEQRQKIMRQLEQFNYWNFQEPGTNQQWATWDPSLLYPAVPILTTHPQSPALTSQPNHLASTPPGCPTATNLPNHSITAPYYYPYVNQCMVAPCYPGGTCTSGTSGTVCNGQTTVTEDSNVTKAPLAAAEKALSSLKIEKPEKQEEGHGQLEASYANETDLDADLHAVFSAWYTAGFCTGKYLTEHSIAKKHQG